LSEFAVFDIETTGFRLHPDSIVEIAVSMPTARSPGAGTRWCGRKTARPDLHTYTE
jgi:hypothetical protein